MTKIYILTGTTRPGRFNTQPAQWIHSLAQKRGDAEFELIDIADLNLPLLDEAIPPSQKNPQNEHTKKWMAKVAEADGFVFVTPEYNHSFSGALKNAIDYVFFEWHYKPVSFLSYGSLAGGARAVEHLRGVAGEVRLYDLREQLLLPNYWENLDEQGNYKFNERHEQTAATILDNLVFWASEMKVSRERLASQSAA